jgi:hypothetical protein
MRNAAKFTVLWIGINLMPIRIQLTILSDADPDQDPTPCFTHRCMPYIAIIIVLSSIFFLLDDRGEEVVVGESQGLHLR